ncbi:hypothetical protein BRD56_12200 [Thermoplasmatales archaeon SW_10_69_26]|jgi:hypothetical protein|nr:MAG: hypothetical protein BRD56_12200 [Thermoplasmatales archaeon SW_10_69_26]
MDLIVLDETDGSALGEVEEDLSRYGISVERRGLPRVGPEDPDREAWADWIAWHTAFARVRDVDAPPPEREPPVAAVATEREAVLAGESGPGLLYDGRRLLEAFHGPLPDELAVPGEDPVVVLTDRLVGTHEGDRYHVRFLVNGHPCIVSPPGFVDGPARDRSFYMAKQVLGSAHDADQVSDDDHLRRNDDRLPTCVASAFLQTLAYHDTGEPFCEDEGCRLFNPHWQEDLLSSMATTDLCEEHGVWLADVADVDRARQP